MNQYQKHMRRFYRNLLMNLAAALAICFFIALLSNDPDDPGRFFLVWFSGPSFVFLFHWFIVRPGHKTDAKILEVAIRQAEWRAGYGKVLEGGKIEEGPGERRPSLIHQGPRNEA